MKKTLCEGNVFENRKKESLERTVKNRCGGMTEDGSKALLWIEPAFEPHRRKKMHGYVAFKPIKEKKS